MIPLLIATLEGDFEEYTPDVYPLGRSLLGKIGRVVSRGSPQMAAVVRIADKPLTSLKKAQRQRRRMASTYERKRAAVSKATESFLKNNASAETKFAFRKVGEVVDVSKRMAKRIIRSFLKPLIRKALGTDVLGADDMASKVRAIRPGLIAAATVGATAAVAASVVAAPAAPAVPVLLPPILDELLDEVVKGGKKVLGIDDKPAAPASAVTKKKANALPLLLGAAGVAAFVVLRKKRG